MNKPTLQEKVEAYMEQHGMLLECGRVIAGVSGGADSVCMLLILKTCCDRKNLPLQVVHIEHGLRGEESLADAAFVEDLCRKLKIPCTVLHKDVASLADREGLSTEEAGRMVRYDAFQKVCREDGRIAVAHNMQDQAETVLFHLARGTGLDGLAGMQPVRGNIIRPLLCCSREEIEDWLRKQGQTWRTDATNQDTAYSRNLLRHQILPVLQQEVNAQAIRHICEAAERAGEAGAYLDRKAQEFIAEHVRIMECAIEGAAGECTRETHSRVHHGAKGTSYTAREGTRETDHAEYDAERAVPGECLPAVCIDLLPFREEDPLLQEYILRRAIGLVKGGIGLKDIGLVHIRDLTELAYKPSGKRLDLPGRLKAVRKEKKMYLFVEMHNMLYS